MSAAKPDPQLGARSTPVAGDPTPVDGRTFEEPIPPSNQAPGRRSAEADAAMDAYASGQDEAFVQLYDVLAPRLLRYLRRQTRNQGRAEDLMQETMLQLHRQRGRFLRGAHVTPWAFAIARRYLIDSIRADKRQRLLMARAGTANSELAPATDDVVHSLRMAATLEGELARLPENQRMVFEMVKKDGLSLREVAEILGTSINAIKLRIHRAYRKLHAVIAAGDDGAGDGGE